MRAPIVSTNVACAVIGDLMQPAISSMVHTQPLLTRRQRKNREADKGLVSHPFLFRLTDHATVVRMPCQLESCHRCVGGLRDQYRVYSTRASSPPSAFVTSTNNAMVLPCTYTTSIRVRS